MSNVSDVRSKVTTITLTDGVARELRFTLNAMADLEEQYGTVEEAFNKLENNSIKALRFVLWAGLRDRNPELTEQQVGALIDLEHMDDILTSLGSAFESSMPKATKKQDGKEAPKAK